MIEDKTNANGQKMWYNIDTSIGIGIAEAQTPILVSVSLKKYGIAHL